MNVQAITKRVRMSPRKVREVTRQIQGLNALEAQAILSMVPRKSAFLVNKTLKSAIANAENNHDANTEGLVVKEAVVGHSTTMKRFRPRARGSASRILKRSCHIKITLTDE
jgi:large subunit ribosomal protein L22